MHFLESLSSSTGLTAKQPFIEDCFFPVVPSKYITISTEDHQSKQWDHFQEYINIIKPILDKNDIHIIEIGANKIQLGNVSSLKGATNSNHWSYILKGAMAHIGPENFISHLASFHNIPIVVLFSNTNEDYAKPLWGSAEKKFISANLFGKKPSFSAEENPKSINRISADNIALETLNILGIENDLDRLEVFSMGNLYHSRLIEIVPDFTPDQNFLPRSLINVRLDFAFNQELLPHFANNRKVSIVSDKQIDHKILINIKPAIEAIYFKIDEDFDGEYIKFLRKNGIKLTLIAKENTDISDLRLKFFDEKIEEEFKKTKKDLDNFDLICDTTRYKSSKTIFSKDGEFSSKYSYDKKIKKHKDQIIIDDDLFWEDLDYYKLYNLNQNGKEKN